MPDKNMPDKKRSADKQRQQVELDAVRAVEAYGSGVRTTLRVNGTAYGYSVSVTSAFGLVSTTHSQSTSALRILLFAAGAAAAFILVQLVASRLFRRSPDPEAGSVLTIEGVVDVLSIMAAVGAAGGLAQLPGLVAWPATAFGTTVVYLMVGGLDVLVAREMVRRSKSS